MIRYLLQAAILSGLLVFCGATFSVNAQKPKSASLKIAENKPSVYISFDHSGKQDALFEGESNQRIWLRLHNNTKLKIFLCEFSVDKVYGDIGIFHTVERYSSFEEDKSKSTPTGYGQIDTCDVFTLVSGKSVLFSVPRENLAQGLKIKTQFYYGWSGDWKEDIYEKTINLVSFGSDKLPEQ